MDSTVASELIADTPTTTPEKATKKATILKKFKYAIGAVIRAPGKFVSFIGKEKPTKPVVEEDVSAAAPTVEVVPKEVEQTSVTAEKETEVVAKVDAKETKVAETVGKEAKAAPIVPEKEVAASTSDHATKPSVVA